MAMAALQEGGSSCWINHCLLTVKYLWDPPATHRQQRLEGTGCRKAGTGSIFYKQEEGICQNTPQACSALFALEEANKRPQSAQEEAAAPGPAGLQPGGAAGELSLPLFLWEVYLLSQPGGGFTRPVLGLWGGTLPLKGQRCGGGAMAAELRAGEAVWGSCPAAILPQCGASARGTGREGLRRSPALTQPRGAQALQPADFILWK